MSGSLGGCDTTKGVRSLCRYIDGERMGHLWDGIGNCGRIKKQEINFSDGTVSSGQ